MKIVTFYVKQMLLKNVTINRKRDDINGFEKRIFKEKNCFKRMFLLMQTSMFLCPFSYLSITHFYPPLSIS